MRWRARASGKPAWKRRSHRLGHQTCSAAPGAASLSRDARGGRSVAARSAASGLLAAADVAAVLVRLKQTDQRTMISRVKALAPAIQNAGAALLLDGHVELVARAGADGAHLTGLAAMEDALPSLKPDRIAGVGGLATRHDSMAAGEAGRGLRAVRRARCQRAAALGRGDRRAPAMVGRIVRAALRRLCRLARGGCRIRRAPARISCWSAISSGPIRAAPRRR